MSSLSSLSSLLQSPFGFQASYSVSFETVLPPLPGPLAGPPSTISLPTIVPIATGYFEANIEVAMDATEASNSFCLTIYGLGQDVYGLLVPQSTVVHITLGYSDANSQEVMTGLLTEMRFEADEVENQWYKATLKGVDFVFSQLQRPLSMVTKQYDNKTVGFIANDICSSTGVGTTIPDPGITLKTITFNNVTPFNALNTLAHRGQFSLQAKDGKLWMGTPANLGVTQTTPIDDGATSRPVTARGATAAASPMDGQDFDIAGLPSLRPGDLVQLGTSTYRIQAITHKLTREGGYTCCGRALSPGASNDDAQKAGRGSASLVARQLKQNLSQRDRNRPAVDVGDVSSYTAGVHTTTLDLGYTLTPDMTNPTVQATPADTTVPLKDKPIASAFAFDNCGLVVPVYPGMRALLQHGWNEPEDAVVGGFVWTTAMTPPANQTGDWWLCLPTKLDDDGNPTGPGVDDLIDANGQRIIRVKGLTITIGSGLLGAVGTRPTPGTTESLTIQSDDKKTKVTLKAGQVVVTDGQATLTVGGGQVVLSDGKVKLTVGGGAVSIGS
jgi:hypothetical protein